MSELRFNFATAALGRDGAIGQLTRLVIVPERRVVTHAVVVPDDLSLTARLVPIALVHLAGANVHLDCSRAEFVAFAEAVEYDVPPPPTTAQVLLGEMISGRAGGAYAMPAPAEHEELPQGEVGLDRSWRVAASDGAVGELDGLVLEADDWTLRALVVREGHLFSHHDVAIPADFVAAFTEVVQLSLTRDEVARRATAL